MNNKKQELWENMCDDRYDDHILVGVCCQYCKNFEGACPVGSASPWSQYKNFCSEYEPNPDMPDAKTFEQAILEKIIKDIGERNGI